MLYLLKSTSPIHRIAKASLSCHSWLNFQLVKFTLSTTNRQQGKCTNHRSVYIYPDAVPPIHAVSYHVATDKVPAQNGDKFRSIFSYNLQPIATRGKKARGTLMVDKHCGNGCSIKRAPLSVVITTKLAAAILGGPLFGGGVLPAQYCPCGTNTNSYENLYSPSKHGRQHSNTNQIKSNTYSTDKKRSTLTSKLATRLAHNTLGIEKSKYSWQYFTVSILLVAKSFMKNLLMTNRVTANLTWLKGTLQYRIKVLVNICL